MFLTSWLRSVRGRKTSPISKRLTFVPRLVVLEDRTLPSTFTVMNLNDSGDGSFRDAISKADMNPGPDIVQFGLTGTIMLKSGPPTITDSVTITGPGANLLTIDGNNATRVLNVVGLMTNVSVSGLTIADGHTRLGGGLYVGVGSHVTLSQVTFAGNNAVSATGGNVLGGAIFNLGTISINQCNFQNNQATGTGAWPAQGGAIYNLGHLTVSASTFQGNKAVGGSNAVGSLFNILVGTAAGGAIANATGGVASITTGTSFTGNQATGGSNNVGGMSPGAVGLGLGGAIVNELGGMLSVSNGTFTNNTAQGGAGNHTGGGTLASLGLVGVGGGGGIANVLGSSATISGSTFTGNQALGGVGNSGNLGPFFVGSGIGGGAGNFLAHLVLNSDTFQSNIAQGASGVSTGG
ncbi:MAG TPA: hypothetical protein VKE98_14890, partial [Gemmataceae bacterium]|nr:hypothetical protein [Gemmataceae bacterium]